jgi:hypothetical protein
VNRTAGPDRAAYDGGMRRLTPASRRARTIAAIATLTVALTATLAGCGGPGPTARATVTGMTADSGTGTGVAGPGAGTLTTARRPDHIVVAVFENKAAEQIVGSPQAPFLNGLLARSAWLTDSRAVAHPSQPNYLALFSGSIHGVYNDGCPVSLGDAPNLGAQLLDSGKSFVGYAEGMPAPGYTGCRTGSYARKHNPWVDFGNLPASVNQPMSAFPTDYATLPTVSFVIPDLCGDMHDCAIDTGDTWAREHLSGYVQWASTHNSILIVTFDEDDNEADNHILTFVAGAGVRPGRYSGAVSHYSLLGAIEDLCGLPRLAAATGAAALPAIWS